jgi:hypothetical protein
MVCTLGALASPAMVGRAAAAGGTISGSMTDSNTCTVTYDPALFATSTQPLAVTLSTDATPVPHDGNAITLSDTSATVTMDSSWLQGGVDQGLLTDGNAIPVRVTTTISASNTSEQSRQVSTIGTATLHVVNGVPQPLVVETALPDTTFQPIDPAVPVEFRESRAHVVYSFNLINANLTLVATFDCVPTSDALVVAVQATGDLPPATYSGTVINGGGEPDAGAAVSLIAIDGSTVVATDTTASDGSFSVSVPPSRYGLRIVEQNGATTYEADAPTPYVDLVSGDVSQVITMPTWATLNVSVTSANSPVPGASVAEPPDTPTGLDTQFTPFTIRRIGGSEPSSCITDASGTCSLPVFIGAVPELSVSVNGDQVASVSEPVVVNDPATAAVSIPAVPSPPTNVVARAGIESVSVAFSPPGYQGQAPISGYTVVCAIGNETASASGLDSPIVLNGLQGGFVSRCDVIATNDFGDSAPSDYSNLFIPISTPEVGSVVVATPAPTSASVSYFVSNDGGEPVIDTTATCVSSDGGLPGTTTTPASGPVTVQDLTPGRSYTCTVTARNQVGSSAPSAASNVVVPLPPLPLPTITALSRLSGPGAGGIKIGIRGKNLGGVVAVRFGDVPATSFTVNSLGTRIVAVVPQHVAGSVDVSVTTAAGSSAATTADEFTYLAPVVTQIYRASGSHLGGTTVTILGRNFNGASQVLFGSVAAAIVFVGTTGRRIVAIAPAQAAGTVDVVVQTPGGTSATAVGDQFTFI